MAIAMAILPNNIFIVFQKKCFSHLATAKDIPLIGLSSGAISMAPITTATEFCSNQSAAMILDKNIAIQYILSA